MPKVSVIVAIYNSEEFLPQCVDSILAQTETDIEILLVDDGSPDHSAELMAAYAQSDPRIRCIHKENGGLASARNAGLAEARGDYLLFVDGDDWFAPTLVADAWGAAEAHQADQVLWNYVKAYPDRIDPPYLPFHGEVIDLGQYGLPRYFYRYWFPYVHGQEAWSKLYRRSVIEAHGLRFTPSREIFAEDTTFAAMYLMHTRTLVALDAAYVYYRQRGDGMMGSRKPHFARQLITLGTRLADYAEQAGRGRELRAILPMLFYRLAIKGLQGDPSREDAERTLLDTRENPTTRRLLRNLEWGTSLPAYLLHTGKGIRTQIRARLFASAWLHGRTGIALWLAGRKAEPASTPAESGAAPSANTSRDSMGKKDA